MLTRKILPLALALACLDAAATNYYVVVPAPGKKVNASAIAVNLNAATLPYGLVGQAYGPFDFKNLLSISGDPNYSGYGVKWSVISGQLPAGLTLSSNGVLSGTPTAGGTASFQLQASYMTKNGAQAYQVVVSNITIGLATANPPSALVGQPYSYDLKPLLSVSNDSTYNGSGVTWSVVSSSLPPGLTLLADGTISGTPTAAGTGSVTARASYKGANGQQTYQVVTLAITVSLGAATPPQAIVGVAYDYDLSQLLTVSNAGTATTPTGVTWSVVSSTLPAGLYLTADGHIGGTPTATGTGSVTARATYKGANGQQSYQVVSLGIHVSISTPTVPTAYVGQAFNFDLKPYLSVTGDSAYNGSNVTWGIASGTLPAGLQLYGNGTITGTPTAAGSGSLTFTASYKGVSGQQVVQVVSLDVHVALAPATPPGAVVNQPYTFDLKPLLNVTGDTAYDTSKVTWSYAANTLPPGLSFSSNGVISGTPTVAAAGSIDVQATFDGITAHQVYAVNSTTDALTIVAGNTAPVGSAGMALNESGSVDDGNTAIGLSFATKWFGTSYTTAYVGSNAYVTFGSGSNAYSSLSLTGNPGYPGIMFGAADNSYQRLYSVSGTLHGVPFTRIRYEGTAATGGTVGTPNMVVELTFYAPQATRQLVEVDVGTMGRPGGLFGVSTNIAGQSRAASIAGNTSYVFTSDGNGSNWSITAGAHIQ